MGFLRKLYPGAFKLEKKVVKPFVIKLVVYVIIGFVSGLILAAPGTVFGILASTTGNAVFGTIASICGAVAGVIGFVLEIYLLGGIVCSILKFVGVIKDEDGADAEENTVNNVAGKVGGVFGKVVDATTNVVNNVVDTVSGKKEDKAEDAEEATKENTEE